MKGIQSIFEYEKGEATPEVVSRVLADCPVGSTLKVLSYMNGDVKKITVIHPTEYTES